jgi:uncharacterized protein YjiS (DUF1127 family)
MMHRILASFNNNDGSPMNHHPIPSKETTMPSLALPGTHRHSLMRRLSRALLTRLELRRSRSRLALLDDHLLKDIGVRREDALAEAAKTVWDAPDHWYR